MGLRKHMEERRPCDRWRTSDVTVVLSYCQHRPEPPQDGKDKAGGAR